MRMWTSVGVAVMVVFVALSAKQDHCAPFQSKITVTAANGVQITGLFYRSANGSRRVDWERPDGALTVIENLRTRRFTMFDTTEWTDQPLTVDVAACAPLPVTEQKEITFVQQEAQGHPNTVALTNIQVGPQPDALFDAPASARVRRLTVPHPFNPQSAYPGR